MTLTTAVNPDLAPEKVIAQARYGGASSRTFVNEIGAVKIADGLTKSLVSVEASAATTALNTSLSPVVSFWALRASVSVYHKPSDRFITVQEVAHDIHGLSDKQLSRLHSDDVWNSKRFENDKSLSMLFREEISDLAQKAEELTQLIHCANLSSEIVTNICQKEVKQSLRKLQELAKAAILST